MKTLTIIMLSIEVLVYSNENVVFDEGDDITIMARFKHMTDDFIITAWYKGDFEMSICSPEDGCTEWNENRTKSSINKVNEFEFESTITLKNTTRLECAEWTLKYLGCSKLHHPEALHYFQIKTINTTDSKKLSLCEKESAYLFDDQGLESTQVIVIGLSVCNAIFVAIILSLLILYKRSRKQKTPASSKSFLK